MHSFLSESEQQPLQPLLVVPVGQFPKKSGLIEQPTRLGIGVGVGVGVGVAAVQ
jgi:hypothetical protein